jgi:DNA repair exonuclease SbcCD ATPase subunit
MNELQNKIEELREKYADAVKLRKEEKKNLKQATEELNDVLQAQKIAQEAAEQIQQQVHKRITAIVNKCLQTIFDDPYEFKIRFVPKRGKTEAELIFMRDGQERKNVGGGVVDVVAFALRLSSLLLSNKNVAPVEILDQPFGNVSKANGYLERIPEMLLLLTEEFGIQFIQVTHVDELKMGKIIEVK